MGSEETLLFFAKGKRLQYFGSFRSFLKEIQKKELIPPAVYSCDHVSRARKKYYYFEEN